jgi:hypothetical protein
LFRDYGIDAIGIDLSPNMAAEAGRAIQRLLFTSAR